MIPRLFAVLLAVVAIGPAQAFRSGSSGIVTIEPGVSWTGVAGSGGCPAVDAAQKVSGLLGSPSVYSAIGNNDSPPNDVVETPGTYVVTAAGATSNRTGIEKVRVCLEGTSQDLVIEGTNPVTGSHGFNFVIQSRTTPTGQNGFANLVVDYYPRDGYVYRTTQLMWLNSNPSGSGYIIRTNFVKWVDPALGFDPVNSCGTAPAGNTKATAYKTALRAMACVGDGGLVYVVSGATLLEDGSGCPNGLCGTHNHLTTMMPEPGGSRYTLSKTVRGFVRLTNSNIKLQDVNYDWGQVWELYQTGSIITQRCTGTDSAGLTGGKYGRSNAGGDPGTNGIGIHSPPATGYVSILECDFYNNQAMFGVTLTRNVTGFFSADGYTITQPFGQFDQRAFHYDVTQPINLHSRQHVAQTLSVASVGGFSGGQTVISMSGTPGISLGLNSNFTFTILSGALQGTIFTVASSTATSITVTGNATAMVPGDMAWVWIDFHSDCFQFFQPSATGGNYYNTYVQNFSCKGDTIQPILPQPIGFATAGTFGTVGTAFTMTQLTNASTGPFSGGQTVITWSGSPTLGTAIPTGQRLYITDGVSAGTDFAVVAQNNTAKTTTVTGDATAFLPGFHAQLGHNLIVDNYVVLGTAAGAAEAQNVSAILTPRTATLRTAFSGGSLTNQGWRRNSSANNVAMVGSVLDRFNYQNGAFGQVGGANQNWAFIQVTWPNSLMWFRGDSTVNLDGFTMLDSTLEALIWNPDPLPVGNYWPFDNNQIESVSAQCTALNIPTNHCGTNTVLGAITYGFVNAFNVGNMGNDGDGAITAISAGVSVQLGSYLITLSDSNGTYTGVTHFTVQRPDKTFAATGTVGVPYTSTDINFTITAGGIAFNYYDKFIVRTATNYKPTGGLAKTMIGNIATGQPLYKWNIDDTLVTPIGTALIGGQQP